MNPSDVESRIIRELAVCSAFVSLTEDGWRTIREAVARGVRPRPRVFVLGNTIPDDVLMVTTGLDVHKLVWDKDLDGAWELTHPLSTEDLLSRFGPATEHPLVGPKASSRDESVFEEIAEPTVAVQWLQGRGAASVGVEASPVVLAAVRSAEAALEALARTVTLDPDDEIVKNAQFALSSCRMILSSIDGKS